MNKELKEQAHKEFDEQFKNVAFIEFDKGDWSHDVKKYHDKEVRQFIDSLIDKTYTLGLRKGVEMVEERVPMEKAERLKDCGYNQLIASENEGYNMCCGEILTSINQIKNELK